MKMTVSVTQEENIYKRPVATKFNWSVEM